MEIKENELDKLICDVCSHDILADNDYNPCEHVIYITTSQTFPELGDIDIYDKTDEICKLYNNEDEDIGVDIEGILKKVFCKSNFILYCSVMAPPSGFESYIIIEKKEI